MPLAYYPLVLRLHLCRYKTDRIIDGYLDSLFSATILLLLQLTSAYVFCMLQTSRLLPTCFLLRRCKSCFTSGPLGLARLFLPHSLFLAHHAHLCVCVGCLLLQARELYTFSSLILSLSYMELFCNFGSLRAELFQGIVILAMICTTCP